MIWIIYQLFIYQARLVISTYRHRLVPHLVLASRRPVSFSLSIVSSLRLVTSVLLLRLVSLLAAFVVVGSYQCRYRIRHLSFSDRSSNRLITSSLPFPIAPPILPHRLIAFSAIAALSISPHRPHPDALMEETS